MYLWLCYWIGALICLAWKWSRYVYIGLQMEANIPEPSARRNWKDISIEWIMDPTAENATSWTATIGVVWVGGYLFIYKAAVLISFLGIENVDIHYATAFLWGGVCEQFAPQLAKRLLEIIGPKLKGE